MWDEEGFHLVFRSSRKRGKKRSLDLCFGLYTASSRRSELRAIATESATSSSLVSRRCHCCCQPMLVPQPCLYWGSEATQLTRGHILQEAGSRSCTIWPFPLFSWTWDYWQNFTTTGLLRCQRHFQDVSLERPRVVCVVFIIWQTIWLKYLVTYWRIVSSLIFQSHKVHSCHFPDSFFNETFAADHFMKKKRKTQGNMLSSFPIIFYTFESRHD